ncbi:GNAT family N-acetyltransferase [Micromonospora profundi]|uniref:GNAT family N-acetyltransferase n=1 Tax=Micromonospora profundi TaxID=1420889 RepID=UPI003655E86B
MISSTVPSDWPHPRSFYSSPNWLRFVDSDGVGRPAYLAEDGAGLVAHHAPDEGHPDYRFEILLDRDDDSARLLLGGRRGFCSPVIGSRRSTSALAELIDAALGAFPEVRGTWWWPYLPSEDVPHVVSAARSLTGETPGIHLVDADCVVQQVPADGPFASKLATSQNRTNWRREWRRFVESGLELRQVSIAEIVACGPPLLQQVELKYGNKHEEENLRATLGRQARILGEEAVAHAIFDGSRMIGYSLGYRSGQEFALRSIGLDYGALRNAAEYAVLLVHGPVRFAQENGIESLHLGTRSYEAKCRRGARVRGLWAVAPGTTTSKEKIEELAGSILAQLPTTDAAAFRSEIDAVLASLLVKGGQA